MAPKSKGGQRGEDLKQEDILQAVVFADSFNSRFAPISKRKPRALLPVANVPMLDYTLEFLGSSGVQEIFVFCCHLADQIKTHLKNSRWNEDSSPCNVVPIVSEDCMSMGDALRDIDAKSYIRSDFIMVYGDIVSNMKLQNLVEEHKKRREKDKSSVMTMVFKKAPPGHMARCKEDNILVAVDNQNGHVIHYQKATSQQKLELPVEVLTDHKDIQVRYDLLDCHLSICTPQVPQLFTDNFDYQTRDDFVRGILINEEIMGNTIHIDIVAEEYAARVSSLKMYDIVSRDVISRWTYPFVPDKCYRHNKDSLTYGRHNVYCSKEVELARGCVLKENVIVGAGTSIGSNSVISQSVIGRNCHIGENVKISGSYLWDNVVVENNCIIDTSVLCDDVTVYESVNLCPGCVLSWQVKVGPNKTIKAGTVAVCLTVDDEERSSKEEFGEKSCACQHRRSTDSDDEEDEQLINDMFGLTIQTESEDDASSVVSRDSDDLSTGSPPPDDAKLFYSELLDTLTRARDENISTENVILEINSLKHAYNIVIRDLNVMVMKALLEQPIQDTPNLQPAQALRTLKEHLTKHLPLIQNYVKSAESQMSCLQGIEEFSEVSDLANQLVVKLIHILYDCDVLAEQVIIQWHRKSPQEGDDEVRHAEIRKQVAPLIQWLQEADEESSEED